MASGSPPLSEQLLRAKTKPIDTHLAFKLQISFHGGDPLSRGINTLAYNFFRVSLCFRALIFPRLSLSSRFVPFEFPRF